MTMGPLRFQLSVALQSTCLSGGCDISAASGPITVTLAVRITAIFDLLYGSDTERRHDRRHQGWSGGLSQGGDHPNPDTGAGEAMASLTLKESFKGAFMRGNMVTVEVPASRRE